MAYYSESNMVGTNVLDEIINTVTGTKCLELKNSGCVSSRESLTDRET